MISVLAAAPLSFKDSYGNPVGYSISLCRLIAATIRDQMGLEDLELEFKELNSIEDRLKAVENGKVDIECGATTVTLSRRERVDFTLMTFITGAAILSRKEAPINTIDELTPSGLTGPVRLELGKQSDVKFE